MTEENKKEHSPTQLMNDFIKSWVMVTLTLIFIALYVAALFGMLDPLKDTSILTRLEPLIFVIIGYYFGRLPAQTNENTLRSEVNRQSQKADAAQQLKEKAQQEREVLEEKIRNAKISLFEQKGRTRAPGNKGISSSIEMDEDIKRALETALKILDS